MNAAAIAAELRAEAARMLRIAAILEDGGEPMPTAESSAAVDAPYGYKADGTPRKRPALSPEVQAKAQRARARNRAARARASRPHLSELDAHREARLRTTSTLHPTERELTDRELVHTTEAP